MIVMKYETASTANARQRWTWGINSVVMASFPAPAQVIVGEPGRPPLPVLIRGKAAIHRPHEKSIAGPRDLPVRKLCRGDHARVQPAVRENLPLISALNASATGTDIDGYFCEGHGVSTFAREGGTVCHCYSSYARGTEFLMGYYAILDRAPDGRDEGDQPMNWLRRHDEYHHR
jgi:hypothetical protein